MRGHAEEGCVHEITLDTSSDPCHLVLSACSLILIWLTAENTTLPKWWPVWLTVQLLIFWLSFPDIDCFFSSRCKTFWNSVTRHHFAWPPRLMTRKIILLFHPRKESTTLELASNCVLEADSSNWKPIPVLSCLSTSSIACIDYSCNPGSCGGGMSGPKLISLSAPPPVSPPCLLTTEGLGIDLPHCEWHLLSPPSIKLLADTFSRLKRENVISFSPFSPAENLLCFWNGW